VGLLVLLLLLLGIPMWLLLWLTAGLCALALWADPNFDRASFYPSQLGHFGQQRVRPILMPMVLRCAVAALLFYLFMLLVLPRQRPGLRLLVLLLYPLLSVYPQELLYRTFFFQRYGALCRSSWLLGL